MESGYYLAGSCVKREASNRVRADREIPTEARESGQETTQR